jgi:hypothetical protein
MKKGLKALWNGWKRLAGIIGRLQTKVLLTLSFVLVVGPTWVLMSLFDKNPLRNRSAQNADYWSPCQSPDDKIESARRQF